MSRDGKYLGEISGGICGIKNTRAVGVSNNRVRGFGAEMRNEGELPGGPLVGGAWERRRTGDRGGEDVQKGREGKRTGRTGDRRKGRTSMRRRACGRNGGACER